MKIILNLLVVILLMQGPFLLGQTNIELLDEEIFCRNKDYQFVVEGNHYFENKKVFVCPMNIPFDVSLIEFVSPQNSVSGPVSWTINGVASTDTSSVINIVKTDFSEDKIVLEAEFIENPAGDSTLIILPSHPRSIA